MPKDACDQTGLAVSIGQYSAAGRKPQNQDFFGACLPEGPERVFKGLTLAVADGISSSPVSREASETAISSLMADYYSTPETWTVKTAASRVIAATNAWLHARNGTIGDANRGHVCTLSALILKGREAHLFHIGDSRIARLSGDSLEPLTDDHKVRISDTETYLGRALGAAPQIEIDYRCVPLSVGDVFVLTTDGVHDHVTGRAVAREIAAAPDLTAAARALADLALDAGSADNLTVQILRIHALPAMQDGDLDAGHATLPVPPLPRAGDWIDGFRVVRPLHASSRSHVFLAVTAGGTRVALKIPATGMQEDPDFLRRFALEDWVARRIVSFHVLRSAPCEKRSALYSVTEFVEGRTLRQWMTDTPRPTLDQVRDIVDQIAWGLRAFHRREMIHQDLRPENVMIDGDGTVKIIDFGSVRVAGLEETVPGLAGDMMGTYQYTAPEYLSGDAVSWRSDQYALGVIAYELLTGRLPYGAEVAKVRNRNDQRRLRYRPARDDTHGVPDWVDAALARAVHPDPLRRYDALSEFMSDLHRPPPTYRAARHVPLVERHPVRFWQGVSATLALIVVVLLAQLGG
ncbi:serine/threonine protein kinase [Rhodovulum sp. P5]|uniref:bifunctional protein-serine/threonine kinase/phosphatase n=1 Tax=Rhodovulum sp. P5 TaxID=1564506 RepID=UPI0009C3529F|nr:bifunctional protein-serine/threonine kinase/phosphatase [Rhodovulum sp. P5]ARE40362.1 serine/threonine protein kinase [Rhodovulum sp. P5]